MHVSVVIPVKDDERILQCVESVLACDLLDGSLQVIVVDNGSRQDFGDCLATLPPGVEVIRLTTAAVYPARNRGVASATGELVLFTDADCRVRKDWIGEAIAAVNSGADLVQGFSGASNASTVSRLIQRRYSAHLKRVRPGAGTECDTRNLAVRRDVFARLGFNEKYRRVGDTEFGLVAESLGFRVAYRPQMHVDHDHDEDLRLFAAKQVCHGWGAQRLMYEQPNVQWHGGHMRLVSKIVQRLGMLPGISVPGRWLARGTIWSAGLLQRCLGRLPFGIALRLLGAIDKLAGLAGHLMFSPGAPEPSPSGLLGHQLVRD